MPNDAHHTIRNGLRDERGSLIGGLVVEDYAQGMRDYKARAEPPRVTSPSYDLGRQRAAEEAEACADLMAKLRREQDEQDARMREVLKDHPAVLAAWEAKMAELRRKA